MSALLNLTDVMFFSRMNVRLGIPDHFFVLGSEACEDLVKQWYIMPSIVVMSQLCPDGMEATMYALLAGCYNLGSNNGNNFGAVMLQWLGCTPDGSPGESAKFENLWVASLISTVMPLFTILLVPWLMPDARQTEKLLADGDRDACAGSLLRRWAGRREPRED